jgi:ribosomal protein S18 acetylase RimI-like enzyme
MLSVRPFTFEDYAEVRSLWERCEGVGLSEDDSRVGIHAYLDRNPGMSFVAVEDRAIVGAVLAGHDGRRGYLHHLAVHPDYRRRGIGRQLVEQCAAALGEAGIRKCHLFIFNHNSGGIAFWKSTGWTLRTDISVMSLTRSL